MHLFPTTTRKFRFSGLGFRRISVSLVAYMHCCQVYDCPGTFIVGVEFFSGPYTYVYVYVIASMCVCLCAPALLALMTNGP